MSGLVEKHRSGLDGYTSRENNAIRDQRLRGLRRNFAEGRASLARGQNIARTGRNARTAQLMTLAKSHGQSASDAENDLFVRNIDEKQRRLQGFTNLIQGLETDERNRADTALANYREALRTDQIDRLEREKINLGQEAASRAERFGGIMGLLGIADSRRNAKRQNKLMKEQIAKMGGGGGTTVVSGGGGGSYADALNNLADKFAADNGL
jgi:hypothetical protein